MKAIVWTKYGSADGLQLRGVATPSPKDNEVLIKVHAATASTADTELRRLKLPLLFAIPLRLYLGFRKPTRITILGTEFAGEIVSTGKDVTRYRPGDSVITELCEAGKVVPVIDRRYPLSEVPEALRYLGEGHARGKVVITVEHND